MVTYVLVHGAWHGGWCWQRVAKRLRLNGHEVYTPTLTGLGERSHLLNPSVGLETHIEDIVAVLKYENIQNVILVGHSYAGMVITAVANECTNSVKQLVYLDAYVPTDGKSMFDFLHTNSKKLFLDASQTKGDGWRLPPISPAKLGIKTEIDVRWAESRLSDHPILSMQQPVFLQNFDYKILPRTYISCVIEQTPSILETAKRVKIEDGWKYYELQAGHDAMITAPNELTDILLSLAHGS